MPKLLSITFFIKLFVITFLAPAPLTGKWVNNTDKRSIVTITATKYIERYAGHAPSIVGYKRAKISCDTAYVKNPGAEHPDFIKLDDGRCFEIVGLTNSRLSLRYTVSGKLLVFTKLK